MLAHGVNILFLAGVGGPNDKRTPELRIVYPGQLRRPGAAAQSCRQMDR